MTHLLKYTALASEFQATPWRCWTHWADFYCVWKRLVTEGWTEILFLISQTRSFESSIAL